MPGVRPTSSSISVPTGRPLISRILSPTWMAFRTSGLISIPRTLEQHSANTCMWALALQRDRRWRRTGSRSYITWTLEDLFLNAWLCFLFCFTRQYSSRRHDNNLIQQNLKFQSGSDLFPKQVTHIYYIIFYVSSDKQSNRIYHYLSLWNRNRGHWRKSDVFQRLSVEMNNNISLASTKPCEFP